MRRRRHQSAATCSIYLSRLVNKSLLMPDGDFAGERRYRFLETIRQYARERLVQAGAADRLRQRHFEFFFEEFRGALPILSHHDQLPCLRRTANGAGKRPRGARMGADVSNPGSRKVSSSPARCSGFWTKSGLFEEGKRWLEQALAVPGPVRGSVRARALIGLAHVHFFQGRQLEVSALGGRGAVFRTRGWRCLGRDVRAVSARDRRV